MFKVNNRNTRTSFTPCASVSTINFEQVNADWAVNLEGLKDWNVELSCLLLEAQRENKEGNYFHVNSPLENDV